MGNERKDSPRSNDKNTKIILNFFVAGAILMIEGDKENGE